MLHIIFMRSIITVFVSQVPAAETVLIDNYFDVHSHLMIQV